MAKALTQDDKELIKRVSDRARRNGGFSEADKQEIAHLVHPNSGIYKTMRDYENMFAEEWEEWKRVEHEIGLG